MRSPVSPDFSGWNCTPKMLSRSTAAENAPPYTVSATVSGTTGARYECVKYTYAHGSTPRISRDPGFVRIWFQPTCGDFTSLANFAHSPLMAHSPGVSGDSSLPVN